MLQLWIPEDEQYDELNNRFIHTDAIEITINHSLVSMSKWESFYKTPFITDREKTQEETLYYIHCMSGVDISTLKKIPVSMYSIINDYINDSQTATWFNSIVPESRSREIVTTEVIYTWMILNKIPKEFETWHLNRLTTLIRVVSEYRNPDKKKMSQTDILAENARINEERKKSMGTKG